MTDGTAFVEDGFDLVEVVDWSVGDLNTNGFRDLLCTGPKRQEKEKEGEGMFFHLFVFAECAFPALSCLVQGRGEVIISR